MYQLFTFDQSKFARRWLKVSVKLYTVYKNKTWLVRTVFSPKNNFNILEQEHQNNA